MKLPELPWLTLSEALNLLAECGLEGQQSKTRLCRAFRNDEIKTQGRYYNSFGDGMRRIPKTDVEVCRDALVAWLSTAEIAIPGSQKERVPEYRSDFMKLMLAAEENFGARLKPSQGFAKKSEIQEWLREHWEEIIEAPISDNRIKQMAGLIRDPDLGKGGNRGSN
jgi:hypothetical protein